MRVDCPALRLTILVGETDQWHGRPVHVQIVHRAREAGLAGASVLRGVGGYGASSHIHSGHLLGRGIELPIAIVIVDREDAIRAFLPQLDQLMGDGLVILDDVQAHRHVRVDPDGLLPQHRLSDRLHWPRRASRNGESR
ncbi:DUF190 domain-containing protein [Actinoallomurus acaciae]|uniref:DUF190 domain-containing protein n=1 Tax=Actinoallomurus acaciae TaxID=502577 RepID=A0ABV5YJ13_9ACTN